MPPRPQQKTQPAQPGLKVVDAEPGGQPDKGKLGETAKPTAEQQEEDRAAARRRLHPPRVWPD